MNNQSTHNVTILDVAREAGVSYSTVSRVVNNFKHVKAETRERVQAAMHKLGYVPNLQARSLVGGRSNVIGLLIPTFDTGYVAQIIHGINEEVFNADYEITLYTTYRKPDREEAYVARLSHGLADGILIIVPLFSSVYLNELLEQQFPYVLIDHQKMDNSSSIITTNWQGTYDAARYLLELGHRRIGFITGLINLDNALDRLEGYKSALSDFNVPFDEDLVVEGDYWQPSGYTAGVKLLDLDDSPTAIFASNDLMAFGAMDAIRERGLRIPQDISVVGFDDIPEASLVRPQLTTVRQPLAQMGREATRMLLERIEHPERPVRHITLATQLIVRESCRALSGEHSLD